MKHSEHSSSELSDQALWDSPGPSPRTHLITVFQHWPSFKTRLPGFVRAILFPVMLVHLHPSLGLMDSYSSFSCFYLTKSSVTPTTTPVKLNQIAALVKYCIIHLLPAGRPPELLIPYLLKLLCSGFSLHSARRACIETGEGRHRYSKLLSEWGTIFPFACRVYPIPFLSKYLPEMILCKVFETCEFWLYSEWKKKLPLSLNTRSSPLCPSPLSWLASRVMCRVSLVFWALLCLQPQVHRMFLPEPEPLFLSSLVLLSYGHACFPTGACGARGSCQPWGKLLRVWVESRLSGQKDLECTPKSHSQWCDFSQLTSLILGFLTCERAVPTTQSHGKNRTGVGCAEARAMVYEIRDYGCLAAAALTTYCSWSSFVEPDASINALHVLFISVVGSCCEEEALRRVGGGEACRKWLLRDLRKFVLVVCLWASHSAQVLPGCLIIWESVEVVVWAACWESRNLSPESNKRNFHGASISQRNPHHALQPKRASTMGAGSCTPRREPVIIEEEI